MDVVNGEAKSLKEESVEKPVHNNIQYGCCSRFFQSCCITDGI
ncbi:MAG: hypothetical protein NTZ75_09045 [Euryarchaeota archaeon]|nr:hypothetical protein [Euryarchaeota archaeon]